MKLYYHPLSSYSQKTLMAFYEKGCAFEPVLVNLMDEQGKAEYKRIYPMGKVPFLRIEEKQWSVPESSIIIEYIERHCPGRTKLIPDDPDLARQVHFDEGQVIFREGDDYSVFYLLVKGMVALELELPGEQVLRVQTLYAGDEFDWSALLPHAGKHFQARALEPVTALAFEGEQLLASFKSDPEFGLAFMLRLMGVVSERLRATRLQLLDMYSPVAKAAGT